MPRKEKKFHFIYKTTNLLSGKYYIGMHSTDNLEDGYLGSGKRLRYSINKHGEENHEREILEFLDSREELKRREEEVVNLNEIAKKDCMNLMVGGQGGFLNIKSSSKGGKRGGKVHTIKLKEDKEYAKWHSEKASKNMKKLHVLGKVKQYDWSGKSHTEETKKLMSESKKGLGKGGKNSQYGTCWITRDGENKKIKKHELENHTQQGWEKGRK